MMRKSIAIILGLVVLSVSDVATAGHRGNSFYDNAKVLKVKPIYRENVDYHPREHCWNERVYRERRGDQYDYVPIMAGAIIGGVVGNQFGKGNGRDAMTVAGALLGGAVGHNIGNDRYRDRYRGSYPTTERRCEYRDDYRSRKQLDGYRVKYRYQGKVFHTRTREHPGRWIPVRVTVDPRDGRVSSWLPDEDYRDSEGAFWYQDEPRREVWW
jgi:uncharacterized protein YcfJ